MTVSLVDPAVSIKRRLKQLGLSQADFSKRLGKSPGWAAARFFPDVERAVRYLAYMEPHTLNRMLSVLRWTPEEFSEATGLEVPFVRPAKEQPGEAYVVLPVIGTAAAGPPWPTVEHIAVPKGVLRAGTLVFRVDGDSMDTGDDRGIKDGDYVLVDPNLTDLRDGRVYLVEIVGDGLAVKRAKKAGKGWVFISDNPAGPVLTPSEARVVGQVYRKISIQEVK
jgi:repressor LexA